MKPNERRALVEDLKVRSSAMATAQHQPLRATRGDPYARIHGITLAVLMLVNVTGSMLSYASRGLIFVLTFGVLGGLFYGAVTYLLIGLPICRLVVRSLGIPKRGR